MTGGTYALQIDLCLGDPVRESSNFGVGIGTGDFLRKRFHVLRKVWIRIDRKAQTEAKRILSCAPPALRRLRAGARLGVLTVRSNLAVACQFILPLVRLSQVL